MEKQTQDLIIIGGGIMGLCTAYAASYFTNNIILLEKSRIGNPETASLAVPPICSRSGAPGCRGRFSLSPGRYADAPGDLTATTSEHSGGCRSRCCRAAGGRAACRNQHCQLQHKISGYHSRIGNERGAQAYRRVQHAVFSHT